MVIMALLFICIFSWLTFKFTGLMLKILYMVCIGLPLAGIFAVLGVILCCTIILIPVGMGMFRMAGKMLCPF